MNSDLDYKKKYLKYKNKYVALQKEMSIQEGGFELMKPFTNVSAYKQGVYLFLVHRPEVYNNLLNQLQLPRDEVVKDSGLSIPQLLGPGNYYAERKMDIIGRTIESYGWERSKQTIDVRQCPAGTPTPILIPKSSINFNVSITTFPQVQQIASIIQQGLLGQSQGRVTHFFIVDYNSRMSNKISCLFPIPQPPMQQGMPMQPLLMNQSGQFGQKYDKKE